MGAKETHRRRMIDYLSDWEKPFPRRTELAEVAGIAISTMYSTFTPMELQEIEAAGLEQRKRLSAKPRADVYGALYDAAVGGSVAAMKEYLDRTEGKVTTVLEHSGGITVSKETDAELDARIQGLLDADTD